RRQCTARRWLLRPCRRRRRLVGRRTSAQATGCARSATSTTTAPKPFARSARHRCLQAVTRRHRWTLQVAAVGVSQRRSGSP
ncbi:unnamed protein product, partial [Prorocentrum cordatum]